MDELGKFANDAFALIEPYPYLAGLIVIAVSIVLAALVNFVFDRLFPRLVRRTSSDFDDQLIALLHRPIFVSITSVGLFAAIEIIGLSEEQQTIVSAIVQSILIFVWVIFGLRFSRLLFAAMAGNRERFEIVQPTTEPLLKNALSVIFVLAGAYAILVAWGINVTGLVASAGIVGLALSFAAQDTLSNLFAGVAILADKPYQIGDFIIIDNGDRGAVTHIGLRSTRILTRDDIEISVPNSVMGNAKIINEAGGPRTQYRVRAAIGVAYGSDIDLVMQILERIAHNHEDVLDHPEPRVRFRQFGESSLDFELLCWIDEPVKRGLVLHELNVQIYKQFAAQKVQIPFPQRDLYIKEMPGS